MLGFGVIHALKLNLEGQTQKFPILELYVYI